MEQTFPGKEVLLGGTKGLIWLEMTLISQNKLYFISIFLRGKPRLQEAKKTVTDLASDWTFRYVRFSWLKSLWLYMNRGCLSLARILLCKWASMVAQLVKNPPAMWETWIWSLGREDPWRRQRLPTPVFWPRELHGLYGPWGHKELDTTEYLSLSFVNWGLETNKMTSKISLGTNNILWIEGLNTPLRLQPPRPLSLQGRRGDSSPHSALPPPSPRRHPTRPRAWGAMELCPLGVGV